MGCAQTNLAILVISVKCVKHRNHQFKNRYPDAQKTQVIIEGVETTKITKAIFLSVEGRIGMLESIYQARLIKKLKRLFPGCIILKNDTEYMQGIPDLSIFWNDQWAMLEVKGSIDSPNQPNQEYYVDELNQMSFAAFISPETEEDVLYDLQQAFRPRRSARVPVR